MVVTGATNSTDFPATDDFVSLGATSSAFLIRVNTNGSGGTSLLESDLVGGRGPGSTEGHGLAVDGTGNVYLAGFTSSPDLPVIAPAQGGLKGGFDAFVAKIAPSTSTTDLSVSIAASPDPVGQNDNLTLTITVTNNGANPVAGAFLTDLLDTNDVFVSASPTATSQSGRHRQLRLRRTRCRRFDSGPGRGQSRCPARSQRQSQQQHRSRSCRSARHHPSNDSFTAGTSIKVKTADISIQPSVVGGAILQGQNFTYQIKVVNNGPDTATGVKVQATLPNNALIVSTSPSPTSVNGAVRILQPP